MLLSSSEILSYPSMFFRSSNPSFSTLYFFLSFKALAFPVKRLDHFFKAWSFFPDNNCHSDRRISALRQELALCMVLGSVGR
jgi:hypothetical protein